MIISIIDPDDLIREKIQINLTTLDINKIKKLTFYIDDHRFILSFERVGYRELSEEIELKIALETNKDLLFNQFFKADSWAIYFRDGNFEMITGYWDEEKKAIVLEE